MKCHIQLTTWLFYIYRKRRWEKEVPGQKYLVVICISYVPPFGNLFNWLIWQKRQRKIVRGIKLAQSIGQGSVTTLISVTWCPCTENHDFMVFRHTPFLICLSQHTKPHWSRLWFVLRERKWNCVCIHRVRFERRFIQWFWQFDKCTIILFLRNLFSTLYNLPTRYPSGL